MSGKRMITWAGACMGTVFALGAAEVAHAVTAAGSAAGAAPDTAPASYDWIQATFNDGPGQLTAADPQVSTLSAGLTINLLENPDLAANAAASAAFRRAADRWEALFADPVTINIEANLVPVFQDPGPNTIPETNIIGSTSTVRLRDFYSVVSSGMIADEAAETGRVHPIVAELPANLGAFVPVNVPFDPGDGSSATADFHIDQVSATKANLKALGYDSLNLDTVAGTTTDATITFNSHFAFDYDASDGITEDTTDFETVALHEIGHALGFTSTADIVDAIIGTQFAPFRDQDGNIKDQEGDFVEALDIIVDPSTLDLFRFPADAAFNPDTLAEFDAFARTLVPAHAAVTDVIDLELAMSMGVFGGDGRQASHWRDNALSGVLLGTMDPTLPQETIFTITDADLLAFDIIGWDVVPEPAGILLLLAGGPLALLRRRSRLT